MLLFYLNLSYHSLSYYNLSPHLCTRDWETLVVHEIPFDLTISIWEICVCRLRGCAHACVFRPGPGPARPHCRVILYWAQHAKNVLFIMLFYH